MVVPLPKAKHTMKIISSVGATFLSALFPFVLWYAPRSMRCNKTQTQSTVFLFLVAFIFLQSLQFDTFPQLSTAEQR